MADVNQNKDRQNRDTSNQGQGQSQPGRQAGSSQSHPQEKGGFGQQDKGVNRDSSKRTDKGIDMEEDEGTV